MVERSGQRHVATPLVPKHGGTKAAYGRIGMIIPDLEKEGYWLDHLEVRVISPSDPIAKAIEEVCRRYPSRLSPRYSGTQLGRLSIEGAYIYRLPVKMAG
jgi:hypothetical protein